MSRRPLWWWRLPPAAGMAVISVSLPENPHALNSVLWTKGAFALAAVLLVAASFSPPLHMAVRVAAMAAAVLACEIQAAVLFLTASLLTTSQIVTGIAVWSMLAGAFVALTLVTDRLRTHGG